MALYSLVPSCKTRVTTGSVGPKECWPYVSLDLSGVLSVCSCKTRTTTNSVGPKECWP